MLISSAIGRGVARVRVVTLGVMILTLTGALAWGLRATYLAAPAPPPRPVLTVSYHPDPTAVRPPDSRAIERTPVEDEPRKGITPDPPVMEGPAIWKPDVDRHFAFIAASRMESGAIAMTPRHILINPYFANLAARALLSRPEHVPAVERWMDWYLAHLNEDGTIDDHRVKDGKAIATGKYDSADSYAATFLSVVAAYLRAGGDPTWVEANREDLDRVAGVMAGLTDDSGLTWARRLYPLKLLMDNAEVAAGWSDWAGVLEAIGDEDGAREARERAEQVRKGLARFEQDDGNYAWALAPLGLRKTSNLKRFYPDGVAQLFPLAFGVTDEATGYERFAEAHPSWTDLTSDHFPWMFTAYAAARAGDAERVREALATAEERFPDLAPPWYVAESAWFIRAAEEMDTLTR